MVKQQTPSSQYMIASGAASFRMSNSYMARSRSVCIEVSPNPAPVDQEVSIRVCGLSPGARVLLRARMQDDAARSWESHATFAVDANGVVDVRCQVPISGTYQSVDAMGLFWSMELDPQSRAGRATFVKKEMAPCLATIEAQMDGRVVASAALERQFIAPNVIRREVRENGLVAWLFVPPGAGPHRIVIVLGGSGGGLDWDKAAMLASHGFATFALAYFGIEPLPPTLNEIPLEYFQKAIAWLQLQDTLDANRLAVLGNSKGGELALLLGATFPEIKAVVAVVPSGVVWRGVGKSQSGGDVHSSWSHQGRPLTFVPWKMRRFMVRSFFRYLLRRPIVFASLYATALKNRAAVERGAIPVEKTKGPILLISGSDDQVWPSSQMSQMVVDRLKARDFTYPVEHLRYEGAGHMFRYPYTPTTIVRSRHPVLRIDIVFGGTPAGNARAHADAWRKSVAFLNTHL